MAEGDPDGIVQIPSRLDGDVGLAPHELESRDQRLATLKKHFLEIASRNPGPETLQYEAEGGSLRLCLNEIMALSDPCEEDRQVEEIRAEYMETTLQKKGLLHRRVRKQRVRDTEEVYVETVVAKIAAVIDAETVEDALSLGQMPTVVEQASFKDGELSTEDLAANHLYVLIDTALREHLHRRRTVEGSARRGRIARVAGNHAVQTTVAGAVFTASLASLTPRLGLLPSQHMVEGVEDSLKFLSAAMLGFSAPEAIRFKYLQLKHDRRTAKLHEQLAEDRRLADHALRMTFNSTRYGNPDGSGLVTGRSGTDAKEENLRRFAGLDGEFEHLNNDPGGKPYTGEQALGYAARLLIEREPQLREISDSAKTPAEQRELFLELARQIITQDVIRMKKGLNVSRLRRSIINVVAVIPAVIAPQLASTANEASTLSRDTAGVVASKSKKK